MHKYHCSLAQNATKLYRVQGNQNWQTAKCCSLQESMRPKFKATTLPTHGQPHDLHDSHNPIPNRICCRGSKGCLQGHGKHKQRILKRLTAMKHCVTKQSLPACSILERIQQRVCHQQDRLLSKQVSMLVLYGYILLACRTSMIKIIIVPNWNMSICQFMSIPDGFLKRFPLNKEHLGARNHLPSAAGPSSGWIRMVPRSLNSPSVSPKLKKSDWFAMGPRQGASANSASSGTSGSWVVAAWTGKNHVQFSDVVFSHVRTLEITWKSRWRNPMLRGKHLPGIFSRSLFMGPAFQDLVHKNIQLRHGWKFSSKSGLVIYELDKSINQLINYPMELIHKPMI